ncbi:MAG: hypothetical protein ACI82A_002747 [Candidatus Azotimanducaceae bacterium]|jgi:hypothetical protein
MANGWTLERRQRQAELIKQWKPWEQSTGPRTPSGKSKSATNANKGESRVIERRMGRELRAQVNMLQGLL